MPPARRAHLAFFVGLAVLVTGCEQPTGPGSAPSPSLAVTPQAVDLAPQAVARQGVDQHALGQAIPAFGGFFLDQGVPTAYLTDPSQRSAVAQAVSAFLTARGLSPADVQARQARFTYRQLEGFFARTRAAPFESPGGVFADLDEANNRITLGVQDEGAASQLRATVARMGFPDGAVDVVVTQPIHALQTLRDKWSTVPGGVQIHFGNYLCSIGVIAKSGTQVGFVTASHCTNTQGGVEGTQYYQPLSSVDPTVIAVEAKDPQYFTFKQNRVCPHGARCRYSDASFAAATGARPFALGQIAQTSSSINWNGSYWDITAVADAGNGTVGDTRSKVGRTTGYTTGHITNTCVTTGVSGSNIVLLCQDFVQGSGQIVGGGDSGSNVFEVNAVGSSNVTWWGGLWGGSSDGTMFVYSPASNIMSELGALNVTGGTVEQPGLTASFTYSCHFATCSFDASGSTGASLSYWWNFGSGENQGDVTASHTYTTTGDHTVSLRISDGSSQDTDTQTITCQTKGKNLQCK